MIDSDFCPHCGVDLRSAQIPDGLLDEGWYGHWDKERGYYGERPRYYYSTVGVEIPGVYDGVLFWQCPDCGGCWHRFPPEDWRNEKAKKYLKEV